MAEGLRQTFDHVWTSDDIPEDWYKGIILRLYKGMGSKTECGNYGGITLLSVPSKVFAHVLLNHIKPLLLSKRRQEQSGFTPGHSTVDQIFTLNILAQTRREFHKPLFAVYVDLKAAFDSVDRQVLRQLLLALGLPRKVMHMIEALYTNTESCVRVDGNTSNSFQARSGVQQGCVLAPDSFDVAMDGILERSTSIAKHGASVGDENFSDIYYADDVAPSRSSWSCYNRPWKYLLLRLYPLRW